MNPKTGGMRSLKAQLYTGYVPVQRTRGVHPAGFRKIGGKVKSLISGNSYDCPRKDSVRTSIIEHLQNFGNTQFPVIATFPGHEGLCVKRFLKEFPNGTILTFENEPEASKSFENMKLDTIHNFGEFSNTYKEYKKETIDLLNYDAHGYLCDTMHNDLLDINNSGNIKIIALTVQNNKQFRNHGYWVDDMNFIYGNCIDPVLSCVTDTLTKYRLNEQIKYRKTNMNSAIYMRTLIFVRKDLG